jgi:hypothetical protein
MCLILGKRLREAKKSAKQTFQGPEMERSHDTKVDHHCHCASQATPQLNSPDSFSLIPYPSGVTVPSPSRSLSFSPARVGQSSSPSYELPYPPTVFSALYINGEILGLSICVSIPSKSMPVSSDVPVPLRPTTTQLLTVHSTGIDRFPFPKMRDNTINLSAIIDEDEFSKDLFTMPSFTITPGAATWDPRAWRIEKPFADKWGFLFY